jgi:dTDP-4-amino-4,6-dideoxygalactose transaminase
MHVPFQDLARACLELKPELDAAASRVLSSGRYVCGGEVSAFERAFAAYAEAGHCVGVASGLDALALALQALGIGKGDEVVVPVHTFIATWLAVERVGAKIVPAGCGEDGLIDACDAERRLTPRTKAILPVHLYGRPCDMDAILALARPRGIYVVEDAAQCHGARYKGKRVGGIGDVTCWSFYPGKNLGCLGDGGGVTTNDPEPAERVRILGNYGAKEKYVHLLRGTNSRLDSIQAALLSAKLPYLDAWNARRRRFAGMYREGLRETGLFLPPEPDEGTEHVWHLFAVRCPERDRLRRFLEASGVETLVHYPVLPIDQPCYENAFDNREEFTAEREYCNNLLSLPLSPHHREEEIEYVIGRVRAFYKGS